MKKLKIEKKTGANNYIDRLPEDLLLSILSRMNDLKILCRWSLVSKRFASTIYRIRKVSITLPPYEMCSYGLSKNMSSFNTEEEITPFINSLPNQRLKFSTFLENFKELKSIYLEFTCPKNSSFLKWKAKCGNNKPMIETVVSILSDITYEKTEYGFEGEEEEQDQELDDIFNDSSAVKSVSLLPTCKERVYLAYLLSKHHHLLESLTITNSEKEGKLVVKKKQIAEWRKSSFSIDLSYYADKNTSKIGWFKELHLPVSGYLMKRVLFVIDRFPLESGAMADEDDLMSWEYDGDEKILGEAVREILTKHRNKIY